MYTMMSSVSKGSFTPSFLIDQPLGLGPELPPLQAGNGGAVDAPQIQSGCGCWGPTFPAEVPPEQEGGVKMA